MDNEKIADSKSYPIQAIKWMFILHLYIDAVIVIKQFNIVGAIAAVVINGMLAFSILSVTSEKNRISERVTDFYMVDILVFTAMNIQRMTAAMQEYSRVSKTMDIWTNGNAYTYMIVMAVVAVLCLAFNSKLSLFVYSCIALYMFALENVMLTATLNKSLIVFVVIFLVWRMLDKWRILSISQTPDYIRVKKSKRMWKFLLMIIIPFWCGFIWHNRTSFDWKTICILLETIYSKWIVIPVIVVIPIIVKKLMTELSDIQTERVLNIYYLLYVLLLYILVGVSLVRYTTLNIVLILLFLIYARRKIYRGLALTNMLMRLTRLTIYFINICIIEMLMSSGLVLNAIVTLIMEYMVVQSMKKKLCTDSPGDGTGGGRIDSARWKRLINGEEWLKKGAIGTALNEYVADMSFWIKCILGVFVQAICVVCSRRLMSGTEYVNILSAGIPYFNCFAAPVVIVIVTIALFAVLFMKNPMKIKPQILMCMTVISIYIIAMFCFMRSVGGIRIYQAGFSEMAEVKVKKAESNGKTSPEIYTGNIYSTKLPKGGFLIENYKDKNRKSRYLLYEILPGCDKEKYVLRSSGENNSVYVSASYNPVFLKQIFDKKDKE